MKFWVFGDGIRKFWRLVSTHAWRDDLLGSLWHPSFSLDISCPLFEPTRAGALPLEVIICFTTSLPGSVLKTPKELCEMMQILL